MPLTEPNEDLKEMGISALQPADPEKDFLKSITKIIYPEFFEFAIRLKDDGISLRNTEKVFAVFPDWHTLIDHLRRELAQWHATTQRELWQIIEPEVRAQIAEIVGIESDGY